MENEIALEVVKNKYDLLSIAEKKVANYIVENPQEAVDSNVAEIAKASGVSDATVIRMCHRLGYKGHYQFRLMLAKDIGRKEDDEEDLNSDVNLVKKIMKNFADSLVEISEIIDQNVIEKCVERIQECQVVHIIAVGNTNPIGRYMGFRLGVLGIKATYDDSSEYFMNHINLAEREDLIIAISKSGSSIQVLQGVELAKEKGIRIIGITENYQSQLALMSDYCLTTKVRKEPFAYYKNYPRLKEMAIIDLLLEFLVARKKNEKKEGEKLEELLSEYKY